ncbi:uncharacterized protein LACBIDRAFT_318192 [Laccaria bicolor S238N-H82]|uniref:Predicted protein n=1 Tax=Laccaria bicolor (strain S238N-H82 / ATCC MYA-4686) TaxID=486041 RepID=B0D668_LACBS|nr:uncharacterized protein LACBIDRAFT_318192 [Laccaria bicolor S238N-H82]EDR09890.1 predicted protein [Laccaria bicolor S238N-H82]|eukprot:XP_001879275.1 predicted protein [Laccaria bicolor S238N-H82]
MPSTALSRSLSFPKSLPILFHFRINPKESTRHAAYKQPLLYNLSVTKEVLKQSYVAERLQPPTLSAVR